MYTMTNSGALHTPRAGGMVSGVAAGAGDNTAFAGTYVDRRGFLSAKILVHFKAVLGAGATLTFGVALKDATDAAGTAAASYGGVDIAPAVQATGPGGGGTVEGVAWVNVDLTAARGFINVNLTPDLSAGSVDTFIIGVIVELGGSDIVPAV